MVSAGEILMPRKAKTATTLIIVSMIALMVGCTHTDSSQRYYMAYSFVQSLSEEEIERALENGVFQSGGGCVVDIGERSFDTIYDSIVNSRPSPAENKIYKPIVAFRNAQGSIFSVGADSKMRDIDGAIKSFPNGVWVDALESSRSKLDDPTCDQMETQ